MAADQWRSLVLTKMNFLIDELGVNETFLNYLMEPDVDLLRKNEKEEVLVEKTNSKRVSHLIEHILCYKGPGSVEKFVLAIRKAGREDIADRILPKLKGTAEWRNDV